jgi:hypothetical protein
MIGRAFKLLWTLAVIGFVVYLLFFVELGDRTLFQHFTRLFDTNEARELREEVGEASQRMRDKISKEVKGLTDPYGRHEEDDEQ